MIENEVNIGGCTARKRYGDYLGKKICFLKESGYICRK